MRHFYFFTLLISSYWSLVAINALAMETGSSSASKTSPSSSYSGNEDGTGSGKRLFASQKEEFLKFLSVENIQSITDNRIHEVLLNIFPLYCSDFEFFDALARLGINGNFLVSYILKELERHGFPDRADPEDDVLNVVTKLSKGFANFFVQEDVTLSHSNLDFTWSKYSDKEIADAWLARDLALFRRVMPKELGFVDRPSFKKMERMNDSMIAWLIKQVATQKTEREKHALIKRIIKIGDLFAKQNNFHGVATIGIALQLPPFEELIPHAKLSKKKRQKYLCFLEIVNVRNNFHEYHKLLKKVDASENRLPIFQLYAGKFEMQTLKLNAGDHFNLDAMHSIGMLLKSIEFDQDHCNYRLQPREELLDFFHSISGDGTIEVATSSIVGIDQ